MAPRPRWTTPRLLTVSGWVYIRRWHSLDQFPQLVRVQLVNGLSLNFSNGWRWHHVHRHGAKRKILLVTHLDLNSRFKTTTIWTLIIFTERISRFYDRSHTMLTRLRNLSSARNFLSNLPMPGIVWWVRHFSMHNWTSSNKVSNSMVIFASSLLIFASSVI